MKESWIPRFSIRRPVTTLMIFFSFLVLGAAALHLIHISPGIPGGTRSGPKISDFSTRPEQKKRGSRVRVR